MAQVCFRHASEALNLLLCCTTHTHTPSHTGFQTALYFTSVTESPPMQVHFQGQEVDAQLHSDTGVSQWTLTVAPAHAARPHPLRPLLPRAAPNLAYVN